MSHVPLSGDMGGADLTLGGPNTGSTVVGALLGRPGENITKLGTILPLSYQSLCDKWCPSELFDYP